MGDKEKKQLKKKNKTDYPGDNVIRKIIKIKEAIKTMTLEQDTVFKKKKEREKKKL